ncbi:MAG: 4Fe-4S binding protein [Atopobiaceae bacterium]|jgi:ferredoxin
MAQKHDLLDDIIDIQDNWGAVQNPLGEVANVLTQDPSTMKVYDPSDYKFKPRVNSIFCVTCATKNPEACTRCLDICPVDAITIKGSSVKVSDTCRKCGLCASVCPTEVFILGTLAPLQLYRRIAEIASKFEECYITCTRALGRLPKENEILLPCVGVLSTSMWFSLLCEYPNLNVYLPMGICDKCRTTTGEELLGDNIAAGEELSGESVGLEVDEKNLNHEQSRAYRRSQFVSELATSATRLVSRSNPALAGAQAVAQRIQRHTQQINELQRTLEKAVGAQTTQNRRHILTQNRKLMLTALQKYPDLAEDFELSVPVCDSTRCTKCGDCVKACPVHANDLDKQGHFSVEAAYCVNCGACAVACPEDALRMVPCDTQDLVIPDEEAERRKRIAEQKRKKAKELQESGKKLLNKGMDALEKLDDGE